MRSAAGFANAKARQLAGDEDSFDGFHVATAEMLADVLGDMKGAAMKLGQILSFVDVDLPPEVRSVYHEALAKLRDNAPPFDPKVIEQVIRDEYGQPAKGVFAQWERKPLAAASIGQVHAARLDDGREVVVKVQYPGVADAVRADLRNAETFRPLARLISPQLEVEPLLEELRERVDDELDYRREAQYQRAFADRYRNHPFIHVPAIVPELCRPRVLVSERITGRTFDQVVATASEAEKQRVGEIIFRYAFGTIRRFRLFNGDPHPGNYLIEDDGRVAFIDYGSVKMFHRERFKTMIATDEAVLAGDAELLAQTMRESRFIRPGVQVDPQEVLEWWRLYYRPIVAEQPFTFTPEFAAELIGAMTNPSSKWMPLLRKMNLPADYLLLNRIQWGVNSVLGRLRATNDWRAIRDEFTKFTEPATPLGEEDRAWWLDREGGPDLEF